MTQPTTIFDLLDCLSENGTEQHDRIREALTNDESELGLFWQHATSLVQDFVGAQPIELDGLDRLFNLATTGNTDAQYEMGLHHLNGQHLIQDSTIAVSWLERAANAGHPHAMYQLSFLTMQGNGTESNVERAISLLLNAYDVFSRDDQHAIEVANCLNLLGMNYRQQYEFEQAERAFQKASDILVPLGESALDSLATVTTNHGLLNLDVGNLDAAEVQLRTATSLLRELPPATHFPDYMTALDRLAECLAQMERFEESEAFFLLAIHLRRSAFGDRHPLYVASLTGLGWLFMKQGLSNRAEAEFEKVVKTVEGIAPSVDIGRAYCNLGAAQRRSGRLLAASQSLQRSFELLRQNARPDEFATTLGLFGSTLRQLGELQDATPLLEEALAIHREALGRTHVDYGSSLNTLAQAYRIAGRYDEAEALHQEELQFKLQRFGSAHRSLKVAFSGLGALMGAMGRYDESLDWSGKALDLERERGVDFAKATNNIATVQMQLGNFELAEQGYSEAVDTILSPTQAGPHPDLAVYLVNRGILFMETKRPEEAIEQFQWAKEVAEKTAGSNSPQAMACEMNIAVAQAEVTKSMQSVGVFQSVADFFRAKFGETDERYLISMKNVYVSQGLSDLQELVRDLASTYAKTFGEHGHIFRSISDPQRLTLTDLSFAASTA